MNEIVLTVAGEPRGKGRPRFVKATGRTFTDSATRRAENAIRLAWLQAGSPRLPDGPLVLVVEIVLERPQGHYRKNGALSASGDRAPIPTRKPDVDNVVKLVCDSLNKCAYRDDAHIVDVHGTKRWADPGETAHTFLRLTTCGVLA